MGGSTWKLWCWSDGNDRLRTVTDVNDPADPTPFFTAAYDGDGIRIKKSDWRGGPGLVAHDYSYGPQGLIWESNPSTTYTPGFGHRSGTTDRFFHVDWLGSTRYTSDSSGVNFPSGLRYDAYGLRSATGGTDPFHPTDFLFAGAWGYQSEWSSATEPGLGLQYLEQRYYDPAVGEAASNAVRHGCREDERLRVGVRSATNGQTLVVEIRDPGPGFNPEAVSSPEVGELREGGMGIYFMRLTMDEVSYSFEGGTTVRLVKRLWEA